jgi:hypothetical protein
MLLYVDSGVDAKKSFTDVTIRMLLSLVAAGFNLRPSLKKYLKTAEGWLNFTTGITTESGSVACAIEFRDGRAKVLNMIPEGADVVLVFRANAAVKKLLTATPSDQIFMLLKSELRVRGHMGYMNTFFFLLSLLMSKKQIRAMAQERERSRKALLKSSPEKRTDLSGEWSSRKTRRLRGEKVDPGVRHLEDPYLSEFGIDDFPRLKKFLDIHFALKPEVCPELPLLCTRWHKRHGFETDTDGKPWIPLLRKAHAYRYLMENRTPIIAEDSLIAGTTTSRPVGSIVYPDGSGTLIWNELLTIPYCWRPADPSI